jgi:hypothetical protein
MSFASTIINAVKLIWVSIKPVVVIILVFIIIGSALYAYDRYQVYQDRLLGAQLIKKTESVSSCNTITNAGEKFDLKFTLKNGNNQKITLEKIAIDASLLGADKKVFMKLIQAKPTALKTKSEQLQLEEFMFEPNIVLKANGRNDVVLKMQSTSGKQAKAAPHTIVIYKGRVVFFFDHEMSITTSCQIQVRYS